MPPNIAAAIVQREIVDWAFLSITRIAFGTK
jgi:hypothetical protein